MTTATASPTADTLDRSPGKRGVPETTLLVLATGMAALSFSNPAWQSLHGIAWVLVLIESVRRRRWQVPGPPRWVLPWVLFVGWIMLSGLLGPEPAAALRHDRQQNLLAIFLFGVALRSAKDLRLVLVAACGMLSLQSIYALAQFFTTSDPIAFRPRGTLSHHMTFSGMLLLSLCLVLPQLTFRRSRADALWWGYAGLGTAALLATLTRSAWLGLAAALVVVLAFKNPRWLLALPVALALIFGLVPQVRDRVRSMLDMKADYSNLHRLSIYPTGLRMVADHPLLGLGGGLQVKSRYAEYRGPAPELPPMPDGTVVPPYRPPHLHNDLLQIAAAWGLPALLAWLAALAIFARECLRRLPARRDVADEAGRLRRNLLLGALAGAAGFLTMGMLEYNFGDSEVLVLFALTLSIPWILGREGTSPREATA